MASESETVGPRLHDILAAIRGVQDTVAGLGYEHYVSVWHIKHACERGIEIISEASRHVPDAFKQTAPEIPWRQIAGVGNILRHEYGAINARVIWDIIQTHLDPLEVAARRLLDEIEHTGDRRA